jgi:hypothetical protein
MKYGVIGENGIIIGVSAFPPHLDKWNDSIKSQL